MDILTLSARFNTAELLRGERAIDDVGKAAKDANRDLGAMGTAGSAAGAATATGARAATTAVGTLTAAMRPLLTVLAPLVGFTEFLRIAREADVLKAGLITATGSAENAAVAFSALEEFAKQTPFSLQQATEGFTKLVNLGLTPSKAALTSYGNTASAMGKQLDQMIEAVADAATGEFERLKEFGIRAKSQGDQVTFTFRGVSTTVQKEASAIEGYLMKLGEVEFAGAMEQRAKSLDGALSNLGESFGGLVRKIGEAGLTSTVTDIVNATSKVLNGLGDWLTGPAIEPFKIFSEGVGSSVDGMWSKVWGFAKDMGGTFFSSVGSTLNAIGAVFGRVFSEIMRIVDLGMISLAHFADGVLNTYTAIKSVVTGQASLSQALDTAFAATQASDARRAAQRAQANREADQRARDITSRFNLSEQRDAGGGRGRVIPPAAVADPLAGFRRGGGGNGGTSGNRGGAARPQDPTQTDSYREAMRAARERSDARNSEYDDIEKYLRDQDNAQAEAARRLRQQQEAAAESVRRLLDPMRELNAEIRKIEENPFLTDDEKASGIHALTDGFVKGQEAAKGLNDQFNLMQSVGQSAFDALSSSLTSFLDTGSFNLKNFFSSLLKDIARLVIQLQIVKPLMAGLGLGDSKGLEGNTLFQAVKGLGFSFGGTKAYGGDTEALRSYVVGERGPELFVPRRAGTIIPNNALQSRAPSNSVSVGAINITVQGGQTNSETGQVVSSAVAKAIKDIARQTYVEEKRYGGVAYA
jgi:hypothetical protein